MEQWTLVEDGLPKYTDDYIVTVSVGSMLGGFIDVRVVRFEAGLAGKGWVLEECVDESLSIVAWRELPMPYLK